MASWIQVRDDIDNRLLTTRLMRAGDTFRVPDRPGLKLLTGNAGALEILVDGEAVPPLGPIGAVRRDVALDIKRLREGTAANQ
jgi:cytoskeleton protein RodZ